MIEFYFREIAGLISLSVEACVILIVVIGAGEAAVNIAKLIRARGLTRERRRDIWRGFALWIVLSLEFALGADIIRTAVAPTWTDIGQLGAIAAIRTGLNWFMGRDLEELAQLQHEPALPP